jgi:hypothetical protein
VAGPRRAGFSRIAIAAGALPPSIRRKGDGSACGAGKLPHFPQRPSCALGLVEMRK